MKFEKLRKTLITNLTIRKNITMKYLLISTLFIICPALHAMDLKVREESVPLTKEDTWLVHTTRVFPKNGCMIAGGLPRLVNREDNISSQYSLESMYKQTKPTFKCEVHN